MKVSFEDFPEEILVKILQLMDILDLLNIYSCSKLLRRLAIYIYFQRLYFFPTSKKLESIKTIESIPFMKQIHLLQKKKNIKCREIYVMMLYVEEKGFMLLGTAKDRVFHNCNPKFRLSNDEGYLEFSNNTETYIFFENIIVDEVIGIYSEVTDKCVVRITQIEHSFPMYGKLKFCLIPTPDILQNKRYFAPLKEGLVAVDTEKKLQLLLQVIDSYSGEHYEEIIDKIYDKTDILDYYPLF